MINNVKLLHLTMNSTSMTLHPGQVIMATPNPKNLMSSHVVFMGGQGEVGIPYTRFIRLWQAALEGKDIVEAVNE